MLAFLERAIKHPVTGILVGVLVAAVFFVASERNVEPRYAVGSPELLAATIADTGDLKILWKDDEIPNASSIDVVLWNSGRRFLDKKAVSTTAPITVIIEPDVEILFARFVKVSRESLVLSATQQNEGDGRSNRLIVSIDGDEALEPGDGGLLRILYSGSTEPNVRVEGRIKGVPGGFRLGDWPSAKNFSLFNVLSVLLATGVIVPLVKTLRTELKQKEYGPATLSITLLLAFGLTATYIGTTEMFAYVERLPWLGER